MSDDTPSSAPATRSRPVIALLVLVFGFVLLADTTGVVQVDGVEVFVAGAFVLYGGYRLVTERARHLFWPAAFLLVGAGWLLVEFDVVTGAEAGQFWPLLVVLFGLSMLRGRRRRRQLGGASVVVDGLASSGEREVVAVFSDARLDFRGLDLETPLVVDAVAIFGDAEVVVPDDWVVELAPTAVFGDVRDRRRARPTGEPDLLVDGVAIFGDIQLSD